ncbi:MAG: hypothetical protein K8H88_04475, partial [Sandaracinaceae bacterium]|nr:hypothetical protein [Sandaracinaceae bacterium]
MSNIPREVLSEHFQERMRGRRLVSAVFTTFRFDPGFFEQEVLPVFFDLPLSHAGSIKLVQLEDALRTVPGSIAVYFDENGVDLDASSARLDVRRFAVPQRTGIFHPKNVLALVEATAPDADGRHEQALLVACMSANLTRAGWWENVEAIHVEEIREGDFTRLRDDVDQFLKDLRDRVRDRDRDAGDHHAVRDIRAFLKRSSQRAQRSTEGRLHTHFHSGRSSLPDFLDEVAGGALRGLCLEVISPYFDGAGDSAPLTALIERLQPREVRVFLPRGDEGEGLCSSELYDWVREQENVSWGTLPRAVVQRGKSDDVRARTVHAKVYRFFEPARGGREIVYVGSANLTSSAHRLTGRGGNWENGFVVEVTAPSARPDFWMATDAHRPAEFDDARREAEGTAASGGTRLSVRFWWDRQVGEIWWEDRHASPPLVIEDRGTKLFARARVEPRQWLALDEAESTALAAVLRSTSLLQVRGEAEEPGILLVQEEGMAHRPSLLFELTPAEILRYWSLLTPEQRAAFVEARARVAADDDPLVTRVEALAYEETLFDRFAGIFHAFECVETAVKRALETGARRDAEYRLFGRKYDSLGTLLDRVLGDARVQKGDSIEQYVLLLCARQLFKELEREHGEFFAEHREATKTLRAQLD